MRGVSLSLLVSAAALAQEAPAPAPPHSETITVTATRTETRIADTPASVVVLSRETLASSPAATVDDVLRQVPGFTLFRRSSSRVANPTTQGVSLRGVGASGASRALVLEDGIPLNDPFGGWVYWGRVARLSLERVEVLRGGASDLYGSGAMGGVVQFLRRRDSSLTAEVSAGSQDTRTASAYAVVPRGEWRAAMSLDHFDTAGHVLVGPEQRGPVDRRADSSHLAADLTAYRHSAFLRLSHFHESRNNGTALQTNETDIAQISAGGDVPLFGGQVAARAWLGEQEYDQTFSAVAPGRASERLTAEQHIESDSAGSTVQWSRAFRTSHALLAGLEARQVSSSARQRTFGGFVEDVLMLSPALSVTTGLRFDRWERESAWSPRLAVLYRTEGGPSFTASAYRAFRSPTLNELYRDFRVGNILTRANAGLGAETVTAIEAGARGRKLRATLFWMEMDDLIANVTLTVTPSLITRQRQNVATGRSRGVELEGEWRLTPSLRGSAGYLFADATSGGRRLPQVPRQQATAQLIYTRRATLALQTRWSAMQYDDDLNLLPLDPYFVADAFLAVPLLQNVEVTVAAENLLDERIEVSATPVTTIGQPRSVRLGVRYAR